MRKKATLVVLAHHDDEFFCSALIAREHARLQHLIVAYTSHGSVYRPGLGGVRSEETKQAFEKLKITNLTLIPVGQELDVFDGQVDQNLPRLFAHLILRLDLFDVTRVVAMAWEGGHADHDASHLLAVAIARKLQVKKDEVLEFPSYNSCHVPRPFFKVGKFAEGGSSSESNLSLGEAARCLRMILLYHSQWKSFLGLLPGITWQLMIQRQQQIRQVADYNYRHPPHGGELFYRRRFHRTFQSFLENTKAFQDSTIFQPPV